MGLLFIYDGADLGLLAVRLGEIPGLIGEANLGAVGISSIPIDDPGSALTISGWKPVYINEQAGPTGQQRLWTGYTYDRDYTRGTHGPADSLNIGANRLITTNLVDINTVLSWRLFPQSDTTANRGSETDVARIAWLLSTAYLTTAAYGKVTDYGLVISSGAVTLDAADYRGQSAYSLLDDCAQASGKNFYTKFNEAHGTLELVYDFDTSTNFTCTLKLSNVIADIDNVTTFPIFPDARLNRDPSRVYSGVQVPFSGTGSPAYRTNATTASTFVSRDTTAPNVNVKTLTAANALGDRYLASINTEADKITLRTRLPANKVTLMREGMRVQLEASHLPGLSSFTYCRIMHREVRQYGDETDFYEVTLELIPPDAALTPVSVGPFCFFLATTSGHGGATTEMQFSMNNPGDPTKRAYGYATLGAAGATVFADEFAVIAGSPNYNFQTTGDSTAGNGTGLDGTTLLAGLYPTSPAVGLFYSFTPLVPVTFNFYVTYLAAGGLAYTTGAELAVPSIWFPGVTSPVAIAHISYSQGAGTPGSVAPTGTLFIGSVTMTYNP